MDFKVGDVVQLNSGGPRMTVDNIDQHGMVNCIWFEGQERKSGLFLAATLKSIAQTPVSAAPRSSSWADARRR